MRQRLQPDRLCVLTLVYCRAENWSCLMMMPHIGPLTFHVAYTSATSEQFHVPVEHEMLPIQL
jgi:hypothetical protein